MVEWIRNRYRIKGRQETMRWSKNKGKDGAAKRKIK
jgi:hypothetical protein